MNAHTFPAQFTKTSHKGEAAGWFDRMFPTRTSAGKHVATGRHAGAHARYEARPQAPQGTRKAAPTHAIMVLVGGALHVVERVGAGSITSVLVQEGRDGWSTDGLLVGKAPKRDTLTGAAVQSWMRARTTGRVLNETVCATV